MPVQSPVLATPRPSADHRPSSSAFAVAEAMQEAVLFSRSRAAIAAAAGLAAAVLAGYVVNRTLGLPGATDGIGNWTEPLGLASTVVEGLVVAVAVAALARVR